MAPVRDSNHISQPDRDSTSDPISKVTYYQPGYPTHPDFCHISLPNAWHRAHAQCHNCMTPARTCGVPLYQAVHLQTGGPDNQETGNQPEYAFWGMMHGLHRNNWPYPALTA